MTPPPPTFSISSTVGIVSDYTLLCSNSGSSSITINLTFDYFSGPLALTIVGDPVQTVAFNQDSLGPSTLWRAGLPLGAAWLRRSRCHRRPDSCNV